MRFLLPLLLIISLAGCETLEVLTGIGAGASLLGAGLPPLLYGRNQIKPKEIIERMEIAYQQYAQERTTLLAGLEKAPEKNKRLIKFYQRELTNAERIFKFRIKGYHRLLAGNFNLPEDILDIVKSKEGQEAMYALSSLLPPPWDKLIPGLIITGVSGAAVGFGRGRGKFKGLAMLAVGMINEMKQAGIIDKEKLRDIAHAQAGKLKVSVKDLDVFREKHTTTYV